MIEICFIAIAPAGAVTRVWARSRVTQAPRGFHWEIFLR